MSVVTGFAKDRHQWAGWGQARQVLYTAPKPVPGVSLALKTPLLWAPPLPPVSSLGVPHPSLPSRLLGAAP